MNHSNPPPDTLNPGAFNGDIADNRRHQLIQATIQTISEYGLSNTTLSRVTQRANLTPGMVNFYFENKQQLLLGTLQSLNDEYHRTMKTVFAEDVHATEAITKFIDASFQPNLCDPDKIAVWHAFSGERWARAEYMAICDKHEQSFHKALCSRLKTLFHADANHIQNEEAIARALEGMIDGFWLDCLFTPQSFCPDKAIRMCLELLGTVFPAHFNNQPEKTEAILPSASAEEPIRTDTQTDWLPAWTYLDDEFFKLEQGMLKSCWQLVGHINEIAQPGYLTFDAFGERAIIVKDGNGNIRAFHNVCRHRGAKLKSDSKGTCKNLLICPFHGWSYRLDGSLAGIPAEHTFTSVRKPENGLINIDAEVWMGLIFIRFLPGNQSVADQLEPVAEMVKPYQLAQCHPLPNTAYQETRPYNWKVIHDIDNEGYHVPIGHPTLNELYGDDYRDTKVKGIAVSIGPFNRNPGSLWSVRHYQQLRPEFNHLNESQQNEWRYIGITPNMVLGLYPDSVEFYMTLPVSTQETIFRGASYGLKDDRRSVQAVRYLNRRINGITDKEDEYYVSGMQAGLHSSVFSQQHLSSLESGVGDFHHYIQDRLPVAKLKHHPGLGQVASINKTMSG